MSSNLKIEKKIIIGKIAKKNKGKKERKKKRKFAVTKRPRQLISERETATTLGRIRTVKATSKNVFALDSRYTHQDV